MALGQGLAQAQANELQQKAQAGYAAQNAVAAQAELAARRREVARLDQRLTDLRRQLQRATTRYGADQAAVRQASAGVTELSRMQAEIGSDPSNAELRLISDRQKQVARLLDQLE